MITCPRCGWSSHNPNDVAQRYCGHCHVFHDDLERAARVGRAVEFIVAEFRRTGRVQSDDEAPPVFPPRSPVHGRAPDVHGNAPRAAASGGECRGSENGGGGGIGGNAQQNSEKLRE